MLLLSLDPYRPLVQMSVIDLNQAPSILSVDLSAILANYQLLQRKAGGAAIAASIKANAYGLGATHVAPVLERAGCRHYFVASVSEGIALRAVTAHTIYVFGGIHAGDHDAFAAYNLIPVLNSLDDIARWKAGPCAVFFDTGMNRLGLGADETARVLAAPQLLRHLDVRVFISHFACSEDAPHPLNALQLDRFAAIRAALAAHYPNALWSLCNSSGIMHFGQVHYDMVRPGYALYGGNPTPETANPMRPVVTLQSRVLQTRHVAAGDTIGYSATHRFDEAAETATIFLGYADGVTRKLSNSAGQVYWQGQPCPILGRISMDLATIGISHLKDPKPQAGDMVEVLGPHQDIDALAGFAGTIGYEILTSLGLRYARRYIDAP